MSTILGSGEHRYRVIDNWAKLPEGWELKDVGAVAIAHLQMIPAQSRTFVCTTPIDIKLRIRRHCGQRTNGGGWWRQVNMEWRSP